ATGSPRRPRDRRAPRPPRPHAPARQPRTRRGPPWHVRRGGRARLRPRSPPRAGGGGHAARRASTARTPLQRAADARTTTPRQPARGFRTRARRRSPRARPRHATAARQTASTPPPPAPTPDAPPGRARPPATAARAPATASHRPRPRSPARPARAPASDSPATPARGPPGEAAATRARAAGAAARPARSPTAGPARVAAPPPTRPTRTATHPTCRPLYEPQPAPAAAPDQAVSTQMPGPRQSGGRATGHRRRREAPRRPPPPAAAARAHPATGRAWPAPRSPRAPERPRRRHAAVRAAAPTPPPASRRTDPRAPHTARPPPPPPAARKRPANRPPPHAPAPPEPAPSSRFQPPQPPPALQAPPPEPRETHAQPPAPTPGPPLPQTPPLSASRTHSRAGDAGATTAPSETAADRLDSYVSWLSLICPDVRPVIGRNTYAEDPSAYLERVVDRLHRGAWTANSSRPKYDCAAPAATIRLSYPSSHVRSSSVQATVRRSRAKPTTSASTTSALRWRRMTAPSGGATSPLKGLPWRPGRAAAGRGGTPAGRRASRRRASAAAPSPQRGRRSRGPRSRVMTLHQAAPRRRALTCTVAGPRIIPSGPLLIPSCRWSTIVTPSISRPSRAGRTVASSSTGTNAPAPSRTPSTCSIPAPAGRAAVDRNRSCGCSATPKKSCERRCLSRVAFPVSRLAASIVSSSSAPSGPISYEPANRSKRPRTVARPQKVFTAKSTELSPASSAQRPAVAVLRSLAVVVIAAPFVDVPRTLADTAAPRVPSRRPRLPRESRAPGELRRTDRGCSQDPHEDLDDGRVEVRSRAAFELGECVLDGAGLAVGPVVGDRVEGVDDGEDAGRKRDLLAGQSARIARSVPPLVVEGEDVVDDVGQERNLRDETLAERRVHLHRRALTLCQAAGLEEDRVGDADLADVVEQVGVGQLGIRRELGIEGPRQLERELGDPASMPARLVVA